MLHRSNFCVRFFHIVEHPYSRSRHLISFAPKNLTKALHNSVYTDSHYELKDSLNKIIDKEINPFVDKWEEKKFFPAHEVFRKLGDAGFLGISKSPDYGGLGLDYTYTIAAAEELGNINCAAIPMAIGVQTDMATPALERFGSDELKKTFLAPTIAGKYVACIGVSEPQAGSDVANIRTTAKLDGDDYVINGSKMWITNGLQADWMCMLANTGDPSKSLHQNKSLICVPLDSPGVQRARNIDKIGNYCSDTAEIYFEDVRVPKTNVIGKPGSGFTYQMMQFQLERLFASAMGLVFYYPCVAGLNVCYEQLPDLVLKSMERLITNTVEYLRTRKVYGRPLIDNQVIHFRLAELQTEIEALRSLVYSATSTFVSGKDVTLVASMCKLKGGRLAREVSDVCLQYWGGMGYTAENIASRAFRDMRLMSIGGGADEVMLSIICKYMGTLPELKMNKPK